MATETKLRLGTERVAASALMISFFATAAAAAIAKEEAANAVERNRVANENFFIVSIVIRTEMHCRSR